MALAVATAQSACLPSGPPAAGRATCLRCPRSEQLSPEGRTCLCGDRSLRPPLGPFTPLLQGLVTHLFCRRLHAPPVLSQEHQRATLGPPELCAHARPLLASVTVAVSRLSQQVVSSPKRSRATALPLLLFISSLFFPPFLVTLINSAPVPSQC